MESTILVDADPLLRLGASLACGAALGIEREVRNHAAGVRTIMLICAGACSFTVVGQILAAASWPDSVVTDPARMASYVVAGIGFLGAGPILHRRGRVDGLTTAAAVWMAAAVGVTLGIGRFGLGIATTVGVLAAIRLLMPISALLARTGTDAELSLRCPADALREAAILAYLRGFEVEDLRCERIGDEAEISFAYRSRDPRTASMLDGLRERAEG